MKRILLPILAAVLFLSCTMDKSAGTISDTDTGKSAMVFNPDITPAVGATVKIFETSDTTREAALETTTDKNGRYFFAGLPKGTYNIIAKKDSLISFQDSVFISSNSSTVDPDTLGKPGSVTAIVGLQPNHDPGTVTVQVLGTDIYGNVDSDGRFTLRLLAKGTYNLRLVTTLLDYTPTYTSITAESSKNDTLYDTLWLKYTGIPLVMGLSGNYDTLNGIVRLQWKKTPYRDFLNYLIFKDPFDSIKFSLDPIAASNDTFYFDTIFSKKLLNGPFSFKDSNNYHFKYRVCIQNNSTKRGDTYKYVDAIAASPLRVQTTFFWQSMQLLKSMYSDSASINDTVRFTVSVSNPNRPISMLGYRDLTTDSIIRAVNTNGSSYVNDTLFRMWRSPGKKQLELSARDSANYQWKDTIVFWIVADYPKASINPGPIILNAPTKISGSVSDKYGRIVSCEWKIGNSINFNSTSNVNPETTITIRDTLIPYVPFILRATDDDGNISYDSVNVGMSIQWDSIALPTAMTLLDQAICFKNKILVFTSASSGVWGRVWASADGKTWQIQNNSVGWVFPFSKPAVLNGKIFIMQYHQNPNSNPTVWSSSDGITWDSATVALPYYYFDVLFTSYQQKLYAGAGSGASGSLYSSVNGVDWTLEKAEGDTGISPPVQDGLGYHSIEKNGMLFISSTAYYASQVTISSTSSWKTLDLLTTFSFDKKQAGSAGLYPLADYLGKLCFFIDKESVCQNAGKMLISDDGKQWYPFSDMPDMPGSIPYSAIVFNGKLYIMSSTAMWVSK
jgi:hypothetical protein